MIRHIYTALKGFLMGAANVVPGVSGGTMALITGIYSKIVDSLNALMTPSNWKMALKGRLKEFWNVIDGGFLTALAVGIILSIFSLAKLVGYTLEAWPIQTWAFFFGLIVCSAIFMLKDIRGWKAADVVFTVTGIALGLVVCTLSPHDTTDARWFIFLCGAVAICTMILPGISGSFMLLVMGKYDYIMNAIGSLEWGTLAVFGAGCIIGILAFAKVLHWMLARWERQTMLVLIGFVMGSLVKVWPWANVPSGAGSPRIGAAAIWAAAGIVTVIVIEYISKKKII